MTAYVTIRDTTLALPVAVTTNNKRLAVSVKLPPDSRTGVSERVWIEITHRELMQAIDMIETCAGASGKQ